MRFKISPDFLHRHCGSGLLLKERLVIFPAVFKACEPAVIRPSLQFSKSVPQRAVGVQKIVFQQGLVFLLRSGFFFLREELRSADFPVDALN